MFTLKQLHTSLAAGAMLVPLIGCGGSRHAPEEQYYLVATNIKVPYWQAAQAGLEKAGAVMRVKVELVGPDTFDPKAQHEEFRRILGKKPSGILVSAADPKIMQPDINDAIAQGVAVITIDSDAEASKRLLFIGTDNLKAGTIGGKVAAKELNGKGKVVVFTMPEQLNLVQRLRGYQDVFAANPGISIIKTINVKGDPRIAFDTTTEILEKDAVKPDAFVCLEAVACPEVAEVLNRKHVTGKVVVAMDTDKRTLEWIQKGVITATIGQKPYAMAFFGIQMLDDLFHDKLPALDKNWAQDSFSRIPTFVDTGATLIDKRNVDEFLKGLESATSKQ